MDADVWSEFERHVMDVARNLRELQSAEYADATPADVARDLDLIDKALSTALQTLAGLNLKHEEGQDIMTRPYNHPVVGALWHGRDFPPRTSIDPSAQGETIMYPNGAIEVMEELRDAARRAASIFRPKRGNSVERLEPTRRASWVGKNFVRLYRQYIGGWPPKSKTGPAVELLGRALVEAGVPDHDPADVLRRAIKEAQTAVGLGI